MDRERQEPPQQPSDLQSLQNPAGWQYEQQQPGKLPQHPTSPPLPSQNIPTRYSEPIADMGTTLGYGQGMEYQYFDVPQPSQPMPQLRQERLQQLRQERLRREVQHSSRDVTTFIRRRKANPSAPLNAIKPPPSGKLPTQPSKAIPTP